ncbi:unnamed protein product [Caenorhabditis brenneri]
MLSSTIIHATKGDVIKMTSSLGDSLRDRRLNWPSTAFFKTVSNNIDREGLAQSVKQSIKLGLEPENHMCCSCTGDCSTDDKCECLKMARLMEDALGGEKIIHGQPIHNPSSDEKKIYCEKPQFVCLHAKFDADAGTPIASFNGNDRSWRDQEEYGCLSIFPPNHCQ